MSFISFFLNLEIPPAFNDDASLCLSTECFCEGAFHCLVKIDTNLTDMARFHMPKTQTALFLARVCALHDFQDMLKRYEIKRLKAEIFKIAPEHGIFPFTLVFHFEITN